MSFCSSSWESWLCGFDGTTALFLVEVQSERKWINVRVGEKHTCFLVLIRTISSVQLCRTTTNTATAVQPNSPALNWNVLFVCIGINTSRRTKLVWLAILGGGAQLTELSQRAWAQLHQSWRRHRAIIAAQLIIWRLSLTGEYRRRT